MRTWIVAGLLALSVSVAHATECTRYNHESDAEQWFVINGERIRWNGAPYEPEWFIVPDEENAKIALAVKQIGQDNDGDLFVLRFGNLDGIDGLVYGGEFYRKARCSDDDRQPKEVKKIDRSRLAPLFQRVE